MTDALMFQEDMFVLLAPGEAEEFLTPAELLERLQQLILAHSDQLPRDVEKLATLTDQSHHLMHTHCELTVAPGETIQWYAVRLEK